MICYALSHSKNKVMADKWETHLAKIIQTTRTESDPRRNGLLYFISEAKPYLSEFLKNNVNFTVTS